MKDIPGFNGWYSVTREGLVWSNIARGGPPRYLKITINKYGYLWTHLLISKLPKIQKQFRIHRLVAKTYIPNPENKPEVNHINGIKTDNRVENLEWCTNQENMAHAKVTNLVWKGEKLPGSKLTEQNVQDILLENRNKGTMTQFDLSKLLAKKYNVCDKTIRNVITRKYWSHVKEKTA